MVDHSNLFVVKCKNKLKPFEFIFQKKADSDFVVATARSEQLLPQKKNQLKKTIANYNLRRAEIQ
jgi:hypothetical protein